MVNLEQCAIIIRQICDATEPGKKMVQKLFYLMERKGLQLNLAYSIHFLDRIVQNSTPHYILWKVWVQ